MQTVLSVSLSFFAWEPSILLLPSFGGVSNVAIFSPERIGQFGEGKEGKTVSAAAPEMHFTFFHEASFMRGIRLLSLLQCQSVMVVHTKFSD